MITIILPWPDRALSPNAKKRHWRSKQDPKGKAKDVGFEAGRKVWWEMADKSTAPLVGSGTIKARTIAVFERDAPLRLHLTFYEPDHRRRDWDNVASSLKAYQDGWCEALGIDDRQIRGGTWAWGDVVKDGQVIVGLEEMG